MKHYITLLLVLLSFFISTSSADYIVNNSNDWLNTTFNETIRNGNDDNYIVVAQGADWFNRVDNASLGDMWNESGGVSIENNQLKISTNGHFGVYLYNTSNVNVSFTINNTYGNFTGPIEYMFEYYIQSPVGISSTSDRYEIKFTNDSNMIWYYWNGGSRTTLETLVNIGEMELLDVITFKIRNNNPPQVYKNGVVWKTFTVTNNSYTSGYMGVRGDGVGLNRILYDNFRIWNETIGDTIHWYDAGAGYQTKSFIINITGDIVNYTVKYADNGSSFTQIDGYYISNSTVTIPGSKYQNTDLKVTLYSNTTATPELIQVKFETEASVENTAPNIDSYTPSTPNSTYENVVSTYSATINQSDADNEWLINGTRKEWDNNTDSPYYSNSTWTNGSYNLTLISHNGTDSTLTDSQTWIVNVLLNSVDITVTYEDRTNLSYNVIWNVSNITAGLQYWNVSWNATDAGNTYYFRYWNDTYIGINQTATTLNEPLWFNSSVLLPEGVYYISETEAPSYNISGTVTDNNGDPLTGVTVTDNQSIDSNVSVTGIYNLTGYSNGTYNLSFTLTGFDTGYLEVTINGADNTTGNLQIFDTTPPGQVVGMTEDSVSTTTANISWTVLAGVDTYEVFRNTTHIAYTTNEYYNDTGLTPDTNYGYIVRGNDTYNNWGTNSSELVVFTSVDENTPPTPVSLVNTTGNFWVNFSWSPGSGNVTDSYNVSQNGTWVNGTTQTYNNASVGAHGYSDIILYAYNSSGDGTLSSTYLTDNVTVPNNVPILDTINDQTTDENQIVSIDVDATDLDLDTLSYSCNRTDLFNDFNLTTGQGNWTTNFSSSGTHYIDFGVSDEYGGTDNQTVIIIIKELSISSITSSTTDTTAYITWTNGSGVSYVLIDTGEEIFNKITTSLDIRNLQPGHSYTYTFTPYGSYSNAGESTSYVFFTSTTSGSTGSSTGTGISGIESISSDEPSTNVECIERGTIKRLRSGIISYYKTFNTDCHSIIKISFIPNSNSNDEPILIESLYNHSKFTINPPGVVFKNFNLYVGFYGYDDKTSEEKILFRVPKEWINEHNSTPQDITLLKYDGTKWIIKDTSISSVDNIFYVFEAKSESTHGRFAIVAIKETEDLNIVDFTINKINEIVEQGDKVSNLLISSMTNSLTFILDKINPYNIKISQINLPSNISIFTSFIIIIISTIIILGSLTIYFNYENGLMSIIIVFILLVLAFISNKNVIVSITENQIHNLLIAIIMYPIIGVTISNIMEKIENAITK